MKKAVVFSFKCFLVILPLLLFVIYARTSFLGFADLEVPNYLWNKELCNSTQEKVYDTVILGDSSANAAYIPEVLSGSTINLSLGGITSAETYYIMQNYLKKHEAPRDVFISFIDFHLAISDCFWNRTLYSHLLSTEQNWDIVQRAKKLNEPSIGTKTAYADLISYEMYLPNKYITSLENASFNQRLEENMATIERASLHRGRYIDDKNAEGEPKDLKYSEFTVTPLYNYYYKALIELCLARNIKVHLIKLPLPQTTVFTTEYIQQFEDYFNQLQIEYPSITVDLFGNDYPTSSFVDPIHFNRRGALNFSCELRKQYSDAFDTVMDSSQIKCLDQDIIEEDQIDEIFKWATVGPYTLLIYDGRGDFDKMYADQLVQESLNVKKAAVKNSEDLTVYVLGTSVGSNKSTIVVKEEAGLSVYPDISGNDASKYLWNPYDVRGLDVLIINNTDGRVLTEKKFDYIESSKFVLRS